MEHLFKNFIKDNSYLFSSPLLKNKGLFDLKINNYGIIFKMFPNYKQSETIENSINVYNFVYNKTLEYNVFSYKQLGKSLSPTVTDLKCDFPFLNLVEYDSLAPANAQQDLRTAWSKFFKEHTGFPKFKKKKFANSYKTNNQKGSIRFVKANNKDYIKLPKLGNVLINKHKELPNFSYIKNATIKVINGEFFVSICYEQLEFIPKISTITKDLYIGLDFSSKEFYVDSNGNFANYENYYIKNEKKLAKLQRLLSKKQKGSNNYLKLKQKISKLHTKIANERRDFLHKLSTQLVKQYKFICVESINLRAMSQSLKLGKSIMSKGFGLFRNYLFYKLKRTGGYLIEIDKWFASSKICNHCGHKYNKLTLKDRQWLCPNCKTINDRDKNAAKNIRDEGYRIFLADYLK